MIEYKLETLTPPADTAPAVSIIGIGGAGSNVLDHIALEGVSGVELISMNCDARSLTSSMAQRKVQLGKTTTQGLGCGGDPELGQEAAISSLADIRDAITGRRMIFLCVGLGGGTSSGAVPVIARLARETGAFVIVFATMPFVFEGKRRLAQAQTALEQVRQHAHAIVCFENDKMGELVLPKKGVAEAFEIANRIICQSVRAVTTVATQPGIIRIGLDDLVSALKNADSRCLFGFGQAKGEARATEALAAALKSPLLDRGQLLEKARNVLVHICGGESLTLFEIETLMRELHKHVSEEAQILFGAACDQKLGDSVSVTIISSLGRSRAASPFTTVENLAAPMPPPPVTTVPSAPVSPHTMAVPVLSVQPRHAPVRPSGILAPGTETTTLAEYGVPVMKLTAQLLPVRTSKPVKQAPLVPPTEPDLFAAAPPAASPVPVKPQVLETASRTVVQADQIIAAAEAPAAAEEEIEWEDTIMEAVVEPAAASETFIVAEQTAVTAGESLTSEPAPEAITAEREEIAAPAMQKDLVSEEETVVSEEETVVSEEETVVSEEETVVSEEETVFSEEETVVSEEETIVSEEEAVVSEEETVVSEKEPAVTAVAEEAGNELPAEDEAPAHPAFAADREPRHAAPMRPIEIPQPAPRPAAKKFDLREILQRQRQTRLSQRHQASAAKPAAPPPSTIPARKDTPSRPPRVPGTPDPSRVSPIRPIPAAQPPAGTAPRHASPFLPTRAPAASASTAVPPSASDNVEPEQATFDDHLVPAARTGRFEKATPTIEGSEDLDVPTFLRRKR